MVYSVCGSIHVLRQNLQISAIVIAVEVTLIRATTLGRELADIVRAKRHKSWILQALGLPLGPCSALELRRSEDSIRRFVTLMPRIVCKHKGRHGRFIAFCLRWMGATR